MWQTIKEFFVRIFRMVFKVKVLKRSYDDQEHFDAGDVPVDWDSLAELKLIFETYPPKEALKIIYGDDLEVPA